MPSETIDANQAATSSNAAGTGQSGTNEHQQEQSDQTDNGPRSTELLEVAQKAYDSSMARNQDGQQTTDDEEQSGPQSGRDGQRQASPDKGQSDQQQDKNKEKQDKGQQQQTEQEKDKQVPFHDHPRWKEVTSKRDEFEQRATTAEQRLQQLKPIEDQHTFHRSYMERYGITDQDVANAMEFLAMQKTNPARALEMLRPIQEGLRDFDPNVLPKDIQALVDNNEMTPVAAKMLAQSRAETNAMKRQMESSRASQQVANNQATTNSIQAWDKTMRGKDPDFSPKKNGQPDGLWEWTAKNFAYIQTTKFANNPAEAVANLEQAYKEAKEMVNRLATVRTPVKNPVTSSQSSNASSVNKKPKTVYDITAMVAKQHGINYTPPSDNNDED